MERSRLQRHLPIFPISQARFFQVEIALDVPPDLVGDLAVAQQSVDEFSFLRNQFPRQLRARCTDIMRIGIE